MSPNRWPTSGASAARVSSTRLASLCRKVISRTRSPTLTASSTRADSNRGVETATSTPHDSLNSHSLFGWLIRATTRGHPVLGLGQQRHDQVDLVVAGGRDDDVAAVQRGLVQRADLAGVREQPLGAGQAVRLDRLGRLVDEQDLVPVLEQFPGDGAADRTGPGYRDAHQRPPSGPMENSSVIRSSSSSWAITCSTSPSCSTVRRGRDHGLAEPVDEGDAGVRGQLDRLDLLAEPPVGEGHLGQHDLAGRIAPERFRALGEQLAQHLVGRPADRRDRRDAQALVDLGATGVVDPGRDPVDAERLPCDARGDDVGVVAAADGGEGVGFLDARLDQHVAVEAHPGDPATLERGVRAYGTPRDPGR